MFWPDVVALKEFYATPLGQVACHAVRRHVRRSWSDVKDEVILGLGFTPPYLLPFQQEAQRMLVCMPAQQGVIHWPPQGRNQTFLSDEAELPLPDNSVHRALVVHALENSEQVRPMLAELWRVLAPAGRLIVVAANRRGIWARAPSSPFAHGQPYSAGQLRELLTEHSFTPLQLHSCLFFPPTGRRYVLRSARLLEGLGNYFFPAFGGLLLQEAEKRLYAPLAQATQVRRRRAYLPAGQAVNPT